MTFNVKSGCHGSLLAGILSLCNKDTHTCVCVCVCVFVFLYQHLDVTAEFRYRVICIWQIIPVKSYFQ